MSAVRSREFLSFAATRQLLREIRNASQGLTLEMLAASLRVARRLSSTQFNSTVEFLFLSGCLRREGKAGKIVVVDDRIPDDDAGIKSVLAQHITRILEAEQILDQFALGLSNSDDGLRLNILLIPQSLNGAALLLFEYGVLRRHTAVPTLAYIDPEYEPNFLRCAERHNSNLAGVGRTLAQLKAIQLRQEQQGQEAEAWVVKYERNRLRGHPLLEQVNCISSLAVDAGFDIVSFSTTETMTFDRYIEVKSFHGSPRFFWSANETRTAKSLGECYYLYLVNMSLIQGKGYEPTIISGPYSYFFCSDQRAWSKKANDYYFEMSDDRSFATAGAHA